jgi:hypothetical protein
MSFFDDGVIGFVCLIGCGAAVVIVGRRGRRCVCVCVRVCVENVIVL